MMPRLQERRANMGRALSGGEQQMLALRRALMTNPQLLQDEPLEGLAPRVARELLDGIGQMVGQELMSVIIVEQHAHKILPFTRQALVLERGTRGPPRPEPRLDRCARDPRPVARRECALNGYLTDIKKVF